ncbi:IclR family transcriptional regulator [Azospirillum picis]|uniref:DNA-binding IclR family transcriptional regulator n=1 Tax=Azospirillum picis TaxID=488438 RepID=A0ABU0MNJ7_9PROT|nr:IclR family transcriptional regulator C-terminal domain-containing protein [Azospirillum picis]MBP2301790.1 DNA-binding IclR family transcriptional regulator [Azospirillum picis]MDQ0535035.1 DNA-binding IclR family transcriptional regulator [Azospirillum picis]
MAPRRSSAPASNAANTAAEAADGAGAGGRAGDSRSADPLMVMSVDKAFRVLHAFDHTRPTMSLTQVAAAVGMDKSAAQRFTYTLERLGYLYKDPVTKRFELTIRTLDLAHHYLRSNALLERAMPYLMHLSKTTEETINLTVLDRTEIVFVSRFMSRHVLNTDVIVGTRMPAYCTAPGIAILSRLPAAEAAGLVDRMDLQAYTPHTTWRREDLLAKIAGAAVRGYATAFEEYYHGDLSVAAAIRGPGGVPLGAINIAVSRARFTPEEMEGRFAPLVVAAAGSVSQR